MNISNTEKVSIKDTEIYTSLVPNLGHPVVVDAMISYERIKITMPF